MTPLDRVTNSRGIAVEPERVSRGDPFAAVFTDRGPAGTSRPRGPTVNLRSTCGRGIVLHVERWVAHPPAEEDRVLDRALGPVLDVGCGPARHTLELVRRGISARGLDSSRELVRLARRRGAPVLLGSVFAPLPEEGRWGTVLLLDGNVGIGGDPDRLLRRVRELTCPGGRVLVETEPPATGSHRLEVVLEIDGSRQTDPFPWALVAADDLDVPAGGAGLRPAERWEEEGRWFARLDAP
ncbi:MAG: class I SAM-dependent methyltransferase [Actinomycetota bacterium]